MTVVAPPAGLRAGLRVLDGVLAAAVARRREEGRWRGHDDLRGIHVSAGDAAAALAGRVDADVAVPAIPAPAEIAEAFGLDAFERFALLLAVAPEVDSRYRAALGYLADDAAAAAPTVAVALDLYAGAGLRSAGLRRAFRADATLVRYRLVRLRASAVGGSMLHLGIEVDDWVVARALGDTSAADLTTSAFALVSADGPAPAQRLGRRPAVVVSDDRQAAAEAASVAAGVPLLRVEPCRDTETLMLSARRARLDGLGLALAAPDVLAAEAGAVATDGVPVAVLAAPAEADALPDDWPRHHVARVDRARRRQRWAAGLARAGVDAEGGAIDAIAATHPLALDRIDAAVTRLATETSPIPRGVGELRAAARGVARDGLGALARRVGPQRGWEELVLPGRTLRQLHEIASAIGDRATVLDDWRFGARGDARGMHLLLSGESGTGKTLAASVLAGDAGYALYAVDLARVVDKYIGETEKRLDRLLQEAADAGAMLLFDEADALFGRRSEVRDARDRYANVEIAYLLQRIEAHPGVTVLTTNLSHHLDPAFARRLHHRVEFPVPDATLRERLWRAHLPAAAPLAADLDLALLAARFELAGGAIRGAALGAAYLAAAARRPIGLREVVRAIAREIEKQGRPATSAEFRELHALLR